MEGHSVIHEVVIPGALPEIFQAELVNIMHDVINSTLVKDNGIRCLDKVVEALESERLPAEKDRVLCLVQGSPRYRVFTRGENMEVVLLPGEEWPNHRSFRVLVASDGSHRRGGSGQDGNLTPGAGVASGPSKEEGNLVYRCQGLRGGNRDRG